MNGRTIWCEHALLPSGFARGVLVEVDDGRFKRVEHGVDPPPGAERRAGLTMPGAANAHSHAFHRALRGRSQTGGGSFWTWREQMYELAERLDPDRYHRLARAAFAEMALAGFTSVGEFHYLHHAPRGVPYADPNAMAEALSVAAGEVGVRITVLDTIYLQGGLDRDGPRAPAGTQQRFCDGSFDRWAERVAGLAELPHRRVGAAVHSVRAVDPDTICAVAGWAAARDRPLHAHVSEQPAENEQCRARFGCSPVELLRSAGALTAAFTAVHATHASMRDVDLLAAAGSTVCLCPTTERDLGDGVGPARRLLDGGVALAIGSDSQAVVDPFEEVRAIELDERLIRGRRGVVPTAALATALVAGHSAIGWSDAGAIEPGARADLVTLSLDSPRTAGGGASIETLVFAATAADVTSVTIDGVDVVMDGHHRSVDIAAELAAATAGITT